MGFDAQQIAKLNEATKHLATTMGVAAQSAAISMAQVAQSMNIAAQKIASESVRGRFPEATAWALNWAMKPKRRKRLTKTQRDVALLCRLGGWPDGTVVALGTPLGYFPAGTVGVVTNGQNPAEPRVAFSFVVEQNGRAVFGDPWFSHVRTVPCAPDCPLAVLREVTGEVII